MTISSPSERRVLHVVVGEREDLQIAALLAASALEVVTLRLEGTAEEGRALLAAVAACEHLVCSAWAAPP